jgi:hypothetical protein
LLLVIFIAFFFFSVVAIPQISTCQTTTPKATATPSPTAIPQGSSLNLLLIAGIITVVVVVAVGIAAFVFVRKRKVNEKSLKKFSASAFQDWVIKRFNGKPSDPSSGISGFTEGGQPLLIKQSDTVSLAEVKDFIKILSKGRAEKGAIIAFNFDKDTVEAKIDALDNGIELQMLRISELVNKRAAERITTMARSQVTFEAPLTYATESQVTETKTFEKMPMSNEPQADGLKPRVFVSNSNTKVAGQVKKMLEFLHYDYVVGDKDETTVPISENKFGLMRTCDCAIINIAAAEQERRYSGLYVLNSNVTSEINAAYLKYNTQVVLLVERKVDLPSNLRGLKRIEYDTDDLSFNAAMDLEKALADFKKI